MIIGITGKSGSGKSFLSEILARKLNAKHVDIDKISHSLLNSPDAHIFLITNFGHEIFYKDEINRKKLGEIVFKNKKKLYKLNSYFTTKIEQELDKIILFEKNVITRSF